MSIFYEIEFAKYILPYPRKSAVLFRSHRLAANFRQKKEMPIVCAIDISHQRPFAYDPPKITRPIF